MYVSHIIYYLILGYVFLLLPGYLLSERVSQWSTTQSFIATSLQKRPHSTWAWVTFVNHLNTADDFQTAKNMFNYLREIEGEGDLHIFNEAILHCHFKPKDKFGNDIMQKLRSVDYKSLNT